MLQSSQLTAHEQLGDRLLTLWSLLSQAVADVLAYS